MELIEIPFVKLALFLLSRLSFHYLKSIKKNASRFGFTIKPNQPNPFKRSCYKS